MRLLALAVMLAISGQSAAATRSSSSTPCPRDLKGLSQEQIAKLPPECLKPVVASPTPAPAPAPVRTPVPVAASSSSEDVWVGILSGTGVLATALGAWALAEYDDEEEWDEPDYPGPIYPDDIPSPWPDPDPVDPDDDTPGATYTFDNGIVVDTEYAKFTMYDVNVNGQHFDQLPLYYSFSAGVPEIIGGFTDFVVKQWEVVDNNLLMSGTLGPYKFDLEWSYDADRNFNMETTATFNNNATVDVYNKTVTLSSFYFNNAYYSSVKFAYRTYDSTLVTPYGKVLYVKGWDVIDNNLIMNGTYSPFELEWNYDMQGNFTMETADDVLNNPQQVASPALHQAWRQLSGSAQTTRREARVLSHRFTQLAQQAAPLGNGLAFNLVAQGDPRTELGDDTDYDMLALRQSFSVGSHQLALEYGMARLDGSGAQQPGDSGLESGYSQFFGLTHQLPLDGGWAWQNSLRYDLHQLDSSRMASTQSARHDQRWQSLEFRSDAGKTFTLPHDLTLTPYAGVRVRHTLEGGYQEQGAYRLNMDAVSESAVDAVAGLRLEAGDLHGWRVSALLEGGPNLGYHQSQRTASLAGHRFTLEEEQTGGGLNSLMQLGAHYQHGPATVGLDAWRWQEESIRDKGLSLTVKYSF
ncbi:autotransporter outer membrane beta-barrel domain-containing protein [Nissabacter sp. SGAir0207]|uniref:autotransporter outer membrane beta-barrel domain-containing protein n=1 Tax=Nissabacter sp. SGAir0207 TaxID=2126321 RepID=UPI00143E087C|nr:autotransporter outer membrane beta-barrel domain-containing protein [Nissabacter sp. SGAir0207]